MRVIRVGEGLEFAHQRRPAAVEPLKNRFLRPLDHEPPIDSSASAETARKPPGRRFHTQKAIPTMNLKGQIPRRQCPAHVQFGMSLVLASEQSKRFRLAPLGKVEGVTHIPLGGHHLARNLTDQIASVWPIVDQTPPARVLRVDVPGAEEFARRPMPDLGPNALDRTDPARTHQRERSATGGQNR